MLYLLTIDDQSAGVVSTTFVTRAQAIAIAIMMMAPGDAVELGDGAAHHLGQPNEKDPLIEFVSGGVRRSARRSRLLPQLRAIRDRRGIPAEA
ncbi:hypothetical protein QE363_003634 [Sphingomonas sp. SORGH_AS870]|uniref:hypothetical protein n=1 Tax=Sphingomonas sp. SORGH_AS_0870 TaxID=3041801 RepID=UPI002864AAF5|nr:hypothetical protein [Sphingomonas sp. SORGH_AS_0870]MDR6147841.1 hypothetical protein [Sphingomonas sp. SORGH_AS_0870]